jgi:ferredoxin
MAKGIAWVDYPACMACGVCVSACPFSYFEASKTGLDRYNKAYPELVDAHKCTGCGICATACPVDCITIHE